MRNEAEQIISLLMQSQRPCWQSKTGSLKSKVSHHATKPTGVIHHTALIFITEWWGRGKAHSATLTLRDASHREERDLFLAIELISWLKFNLGHRQAPHEKPRRSIASQCHTIGLPGPTGQYACRAGASVPLGQRWLCRSQAGRMSCQVFRKEIQWQSGWQHLCKKDGMQRPHPARRDNTFWQKVGPPVPPWGPSSPPISHRHWGTQSEEVCIQPAHLHWWVKRKQMDVHNTRLLNNSWRYTLMTF